MAVVVQALVAIGGRATRLPEVEVPVSKAFLPGLGGFPFLHWCLRSLEMAGIRRVVLAAHSRSQAARAQDVLDARSWCFDRVEFFCDEGRGVHGIPFQARGVLDDVVLFEAGHGVCDPEHYRLLMARKTSKNVVFSAFTPRADNPRFTTPLGSGEPWALAHPMVIDRDYAHALRSHGFNVNETAAAYRASGRLLAVPAPTPVEFDVAREYHRTLNVHRANAADCLDGLPWRHRPRAHSVELTSERRDAIVV